ncbi:MAG: TetR/AcrR family transcriptional regulator, partial [Anaerolineales bacterium]|nr:TetR/AcrR family transcriptional regulator [Anaerolineales bacterium]
MEQELSQTKEILIEAAYALFAEQGYHGTSMRHIAKRANLALGGIYNHFENKEEIFKAVVLTYHPFVVALPQFTAVEGSSAAEFLRNAVHLIIQEIEKRPEIVNIVFIEMIELKGQHLDELAEQILPKAEEFAPQLIAFADQLRDVSPVVILRSFAGLIFSYFVTGKLL